MNPLERFLHRPRIAYFSMEIGLDPDIHTYAGGLGLLAGDTLRTAADLELPLVGVTLVSRQGHFRQEIDPVGSQHVIADPWEPERHAISLDARIGIPIDGRKVWLQAWLYEVTGAGGHRVPVILLDTDLDENDPADRGITDRLYGDGEDYRLRQEIVLGIGGVRMLHALGFAIQKFHMNEGHSALLALELLRRYERDTDTAGSESIYDAARVRERCDFTTHTPVDAGHDRFAWPRVQALLDDFIDLGELRALAGNDNLNMTRLALNLSGYVNGVAKTHAVVSNAMFPGYHVHAVTNGVHPTTWTHERIADLYDQHIPEWRHEPELLIRADAIDDGALWAAHLQARRELIDCVERETAVRLDPDWLIIGFARRMTAYKRAMLLLEQPNRLLAIAARQPLQIVFAGKAHPGDTEGRRVIERIHALAAKLRGEVRIAFVPDYDWRKGQCLVAGADVWLNTPLRPQEASGTSGMKAALNGVPHLSVLDGWWSEACIEGVNGWAIGPKSGPEVDAVDAEALYDKLEHTVLPLYYTDHAGWMRVMKGAITRSASFFNSHRMMRRYATEAYIR